jgi:uncharacterized membrane protein YeaQ/YmgE (transglycosylase-associated protein family)
MEENPMHLIAWIILDLIAGFIATPFLVDVSTEQRAS